MSNFFLFSKKKYNWTRLSHKRQQMRLIVQNIRGNFVLKCEVIVLMHGDIRECWKTLWTHPYPYLYDIDHFGLKFSWFCFLVFSPKLLILIECYTCLYTHKSSNS